MILLCLVLVKTDQAFTKFLLFELKVWLTAAKGKGMEITGTLSRKNGQIIMDMTFTNRAMQPMMGFAIQFNKNR